jgi:hypothetical protein
MITLSSQSKCSTSSALDVISATFRLSNSTLDGAVSPNSGGSNGLSVFTSQGPTVSGTITGTTLRRWNTGLQVGGSVRIEHSEISDSTTGLSTASGNASLDDVTITRNRFGLRVVEIPTSQRGTLTMRNSRILDSIQIGVDLEDPVSADLGTPESPGNNTLTATTSVGLWIHGQTGPMQIHAVGNTWMPNVQGADALGHYSVRQILVGPIAAVAGSNFLVDNGWSLQL